MGAVAEAVFALVLVAAFAGCQSLLLPMEYEQKEAY